MLKSTRESIFLGCRGSVAVPRGERTGSVGPSAAVFHTWHTIYASVASSDTCGPIIEIDSRNAQRSVSTTRGVLPDPFEENVSLPFHFDDIHHGLKTERRDFSRSNQPLSSAASSRQYQRSSFISLQHCRAHKRLEESLASRNHIGQSHLSFVRSRRLNLVCQVDMCPGWKAA
jgi:hypothetical protein